MCEAIFMQKILAIEYILALYHIKNTDIGKMEENYMCEIFRVFTLHITSLECENFLL